MTDRRYLVTWVIDIEDVDSPTEAAEKAWEHMRRPGSTANVFTVTDDTGTYEVDLDEKTVTEAPKEWTVLGAWINDHALVVGVIEGKHEVHGGDDTAFSDGMEAVVEDGQGLWATSVEAATAEAAEALAVEEMESTLLSDEHPHDYGDYSDVQ